MTGVFISYASSSKAAAERIAQALRAMGYDVWRDDALPPHRPYAEVIEERLREAGAVLVVWSNAAAHSQWVRAEADYARQKGKLVQLAIDGTMPPMPFNQIQCADLTRWRGDPNHAEWRKVAASLAELLSANEASAPAVATTRRFHWRRLATAVAALALAVGAGAGYWALRYRPLFAAKPPDRVAVLPFTVEGADASLQGFADGLLDETLGALSSDHVQALSREESVAMRGPAADEISKRLGVGLFLDGAVRRVGDTLKVRLYLNDAKDHTTLWSKDFERPAAQADAMQAQVAARAADVTHSALVAHRDAGGTVDASVVADFVEAMDEMSNGGHQGEILLRRVIAKAPRFSHAYSLLGMSIEASPGQSKDDLVAKQRALARRALELDPHNGEAWALLASIARLGDWTARDDALENATRAEPTFAPGFHLQSKFFGEIGRFKDALAAAQQGAALNDKFVGGGLDPCFRLTLARRFEEARPSCERADRLWPEASQFQQFYADLEAGQDAQALARLQQGSLLRDAFGADNTAALIDFLHARLAGDAAGARAAALSAGKAADVGKVDRRFAFLELAMTNQIDAALAQGLQWFTPALGQTDPWTDFFDSTLLFAPATASVRRDPRFITIAAQFGLADYWRRSGKWPDFCAEPGLPYDCRAEAAKLKPAKG